MSQQLPSNIVPALHEPAHGPTPIQQGIPVLGNVLKITRCPHCNVDNPNMPQQNAFETKNSEGRRKRLWKTYVCGRCGGVVTASSLGHGNQISEMFPKLVTVSDEIPDKARNYLLQSIQSIHAPAGAVILAASSVDAMLKSKGYTNGTLNSRINLAAEQHLITKEMAQWAHSIRLDANEQRHADMESELPSEFDAKRCVDFAIALGEFLFVLPAQVNRGLNEAVKPANI